MDHSFIIREGSIIRNGQCSYVSEFEEKKAFVCFPEYAHGDNVKRVSVPRTDAAVRGA